MDISVIVLTYNEELHIRRCIENVKPWVQDIFVVDCFSTDRTVEIAKQLEAQVFQHEWPGNQAAQFNWALNQLPIRSGWVLRLDADEYLCPGLIEELKSRLVSLPEDVSGVVFKRRHIFLGRWIKHGTYPIRLLRLFRYGKARCEQRLMDEYVELLEGRSVEFDGDFVDHNLNDIGWWTAKHNGYALRGAVDLLDIEYGLLAGETEKVKREAGDEVPTERKQMCKGLGLGEQAAAKRAKKHRYARMPLFLRAFAYFIMRYVVMGGFLEGREGFLWHFLQGWWYRTLVDAKVLEIKRESGGDKGKMLGLLRGKYGMKI